MDLALYKINGTILHAYKPNYSYRYIWSFIMKDFFINQMYRQATYGF